jgi:hypothetical protein
MTAIAGMTGWTEAVVDFALGWTEAVVDFEHSDYWALHN